ncbi:hypothetical protein HGRIS_006037 [Hohenbuehelia grisea]|uniref:F-box domain-containing protein n=1 Tax=Hohenbuehelia grisea TaxID=104357 RepID=A0ABR3K152_9AGAR
MPPRSIPLEIAHLIINLLPTWHNRHNLHSTALVCSAWLPVARAIIFRDIHLTSRNVAKFIELASADPSFVQRTRELTLHPHMDETLTGPTLLESLPQLSCLARSPITALTIDDCDDAHGGNIRDQVHRLAKFIAATLPKITDLSINIMRFDSIASIQTFASALPNVSNLHLDIVVMDDLQEDEDEDTVLHPIFPKLRTFLGTHTDLEECRWFMDALVTMEPWPAVEDVTVFGVNREDISIWSSHKLLEKVSSSVTSLHLHHQYIHVEDTYEAVSLPPLPLLRKLEVYFSDPRPEISSWDAIVPIAHIFASICSPQIEEITIGFDNTMKDSEAMIRWANWSDLDRVLSGPQFVSLKRLNVSTERDGDDPEFKSNLDLIAEQMKYCDRENTLRIVHD